MPLNVNTRNMIMRIIKIINQKNNVKSKHNTHSHSYFFLFILNYNYNSIYKC